MQLPPASVSILPFSTLLRAVLGRHLSLDALVTSPATARSSPDRPRKPVWEGKRKHSGGATTSRSTALHWVPFVAWSGWPHLASPELAASLLPASPTHTHRQHLAHSHLTLSADSPTDRPTVDKTATQETSPRMGRRVCKVRLDRTRFSAHSASPHRSAPTSTTRCRWLRLYHLLAPDSRSLIGWGARLARPLS